MSHGNPEPTRRKHDDGTGWHQFADADTLATHLATDVANRLQTGLSVRGIASLIVSGGRTPTRFFDLLGTVDLAWERVTICLTDERWVEPDSADSNEKLVRDHLLHSLAGAATFVPLKTVAADPESAVLERTSALLKVAQPFDVVMLGMGVDGHTASLFPGAAGIVKALGPAASPALVAVSPLVASHRRISMNLAALLHARYIAILIQGAHKRAVLEAARDGASPLAFPIAAILQQSRVPVGVYWSA